MFDTASAIAEQLPGKSSLGLHGVQGAGTALHRAASQFAIVAKDASVTGDLKAALAALVRVSQTGVACHASYRIQ